MIICPDGRMIVVDVVTQKAAHRAVDIDRCRTERVKFSR